MDEIKERQEWLNDMIRLGKGGQYKNQIQTEISVVCEFDYFEKLSF